MRELGLALTLLAAIPALALPLLAGVAVLSLPAALIGAAASAIEPRVAAAPAAGMTGGDATVMAMTTRRDAMPRPDRDAPRQ